MKIAASSSIFTLCRRGTRFRHSSKKGLLVAAGLYTYVRRRGVLFSYTMSDKRPEIRAIIIYNRGRLYYAMTTKTKATAKRGPPISFSSSYPLFVNKTIIPSKAAEVCNCLSLSLIGHARFISYVCGYRSVCVCVCVW